MQRIRNLLEELLGSDTKADLLMLFHQNPRLIDDLEGLARRVGSTPEVIEKNVLDLVRLGFLEISPLRRGEAISLNRSMDKEVQRKIASHILVAR